MHENELADVRQYLLPTQTVCTVSDTVDVDEGVRIVPICGHTDGSLVVELPMEERTVVLCGDECYHRDCFSFPHLSGGSRNRAQTQAFFEKYRDEHYQTVLFHDPVLVGSIGFKRLI